MASYLHQGFYNGGFAFKLREHDYKSTAAQAHLYTCVFVHVCIYSAFQKYGIKINKFKHVNIGLKKIQNVFTYNECTTSRSIIKYVSPRLLVPTCL